MTRTSLVIRLVFAICLLAASVNHIVAVVQHGPLWDYGFGSRAPFASRIYWSALTLFDPLAIVLLFLRPRAGIVLTVLIIVSDVIHNTYYVAMADLWTAPFYLSQVAFLVFVLVFAPLAWRTRTAAQ
ncbi:hypothetical protein N0A02_07215 [Paraburkholderia acidicola]|uniref:Uncharacterized protein n=1 Tax=Paraburkholderia acidicola TaxID=1912599 RepID=A0ABV1LIW4_9BURK